MAILCSAVFAICFSLCNKPVPNKVQQGHPYSFQKALVSAFFLNWSKHCSTQTAQRAFQEIFFIQELSRMWSWTSTVQRTFRSALVIALANIANALFLLSWIGIFLKTQQLATSMWMQHSQNTCLQLDFQSSSVELCAVENGIHCFHEKKPHTLFSSLLAISICHFAQSCCSHFLPLNSPQKQ